MTSSDASPGWRLWWVGALLALVLLGIGVARTWPRTDDPPGPTLQEALVFAAQTLRAQAPEVFAGFQVTHPPPIPPDEEPGPSPRYERGLAWIRAKGPRDVRTLLEARWALFLGRRADAVRTLAAARARGAGGPAVDALEEVLRTD